MPKVILICGKIASGKSFYANKIKNKEKAVILNTDELTFALFDNEQGEKYEDRANRANNYLMKKAVELIKAECNVILDWGFWTIKSRNEITRYFQDNNIDTEWHYIDIEDAIWIKNIKERNEKVEKGNGGSDFYITEGLKSKVLSMFEIPSKEEIDVWYKLKR
ncbi:MAG: ATP-binding protein [Clostridia bacterium]|nr:ATP-binding protein [Clostridia bacterium]